MLGSAEELGVSGRSRHSAPRAAVGTGSSQGAPGTPGPAEADKNAAQVHWAFRPVEKIAPPGRYRSPEKNPVDQFILAGLHSQKLKANGPATKRALARRVYFDLVGLPPTPEEMGLFLKDPAPDAYARLIERLLASPRYGERWGRHWMDVVRYADTAGDNADYPVPEARRYRDYIIDAFNSDKPYDQFVQEQLAGDLLAREGADELHAERVVATGFLALSRRYATAPFELMHLTLEDVIDTTGRAFMGLTLRCARCHDHKYDPVTKEDYYALYGMFESTEFPYAGSEEFESKKFDRTGFRPLLPEWESGVGIRAWKEKLGALRSQIQALEKQTNAPDAAKKQLEGLRADLRKLGRAGVPPGVACAYAVGDAKAVDSRIQVRGEPGDPGPVVKRRPPLFLSNGGQWRIAEGSSGRLEFARWLTRADNPLTARVMVNRIWQHHFGKGLVATPSNFGVRGEAPTHPELLDYLAGRFVDSGWSVKAMHRLILLSKAYRRSGDWNESNGRKDEANRFYWRFDRRRLEAEEIRDGMMSVSGTLDLKRPEEHPFPMIDDWHWTQHNPFKAVYGSNHRSVYLMIQRIQRHPYLSLFDAPDANTSTDVRTSATVPLQALYLMNDTFVQNQAGAFARRLIAVGTDPADRIRLAVEQAWGRTASRHEIASGSLFIQRYGQELIRAGAAPGLEDKGLERGAGIGGQQVELEAWTSYARVLLTANEFLYVD